jgi:hypothetical protein
MAQATTATAPNNLNAVLSLLLAFAGLYVACAASIPAPLWLKAWGKDNALVASFLALHGSTVILCLFTLVLAVPAIVLGNVGLAEVEKSNFAERGAGAAVFGVVIGTLNVLTAAIVLFAYMWGVEKYWQ